MFEYSAGIRSSDEQIPKIPSEIAEIVSSSNSVLDVGCASGRLEAYVPDKKNYIGLSYSEADIKALEKKGLKGYQVNLDLENIPLENETIECVFASHIVEHFEKAELIHLMRECYRVLKPGGRIILATPTDYNSFFFAERTHVRPYNHGSLPELLKDFEFVDVDRMYPPLRSLPKRWQALLRFPLFFLKDIWWKEIIAWGKKPV